MYSARWLLSYRPTHLSKAFMPTKAFYVRLFTLVCITTLLAALLPIARDFPGQFGDKIQHATAFIVLTVLAALAFPAVRPAPLILSMAGLGAAIELLQLLPVVHRDAEMADWVTDCAAILVAAPMAALARRALLPASERA